MNNYSTKIADVHVKRATKSGTPWRHKSIICDGDFVNDLMADGFFAPKVPGVSPVVGAIHSITDSIDSLDAKKACKSFRSPRLPPISLPCTHPDSFKPKRKPWRDTGEEINGLFFHKALESAPSVKGFTLMLSRPVEALARAQGKGCLAWLHKRLVRKLKPLSRARGCPVAFWFTIQEQPTTGRLHIHGEISIGHVYGEKRTVRALRRVFAPIRKALKSAGGTWDADRDGDCTQLRFARGTPDFRWAGYCVRDAHKARPERRRLMRQYGLDGDRRYVAQFDGRSVTAGSGVRQKTIALHAAAVDELARSGA